MPTPLLVKPLSSSADQASQLAVRPARILKVIDGDTLRIQDGPDVRIASIDAPETRCASTKKSQDFSQSASRYLRELIGPLPATAQLKCYERDGYGRLVCDVQKEGKDIGQAMVEAGYAWANTAYSSRYLRAPHLVFVQQKAQRLRKGLWQNSSTATPPWEWRTQCKKINLLPINKLSVFSES